MQLLLIDWLIDLEVEREERENTPIFCSHLRGMNQGEVKNQELNPGLLRETQLHAIFSCLSNRVLAGRIESWNLDQS